MLDQRQLRVPISREQRLRDERRTNSGELGTPLSPGSARGREEVLNPTSHELFIVLGVRWRCKGRDALKASPGEASLPRKGKTAYWEGEKPIGTSGECQLHI